MASLTRGIPLSKISPKFLHSNATSHTWPFSAVAELIDNAYDPDVSASELRIDKSVIHGKPCLVFEDDGAGMNFEKLLKMLSFGYCDKDAFEQDISHLPIGHYGNGFKSGSMRLGRDAVVFTVCETSASVGFLSQTYLEAIGADCVFVPIIEYRLPHQRFKSQESRNNMEAILTHSPFRTEQDLKAELRTLYSHRSTTGTRIVLFNLKRHRTGKLELDFESDNTDIRNPEAHEVDLTSVYHRTSQVETSEYVRSLRKYCGLLFLRPRMKIYIRGVKVKTKLISKSLSSTEIDVYKPTWLDKPLRITFGFNPKARLKEDYGVMFYHRNRLIKPYEKLGYQKQPNDLGMGVVGVVQVDFLKPIHNKQDFEKDEKYNAIMSAIGLKLNDYWNEKRNGQAEPTEAPISSQTPDWLWVQCDKCLKWRRLPDSFRANELPDRWFCHMNPDPTHNRCDIPEEPEDEDEAVRRPTYEKTFKKKQEERKRRKQHEIATKEAELKAREAALERRQHQLNEVTSSHQSQRDIADLQRALREAKRREEDQKRLIVRIQNQKRQIANQQNSLVEAANNLQSASNASAELLEVAAALTDENPVSSTSGRGTKRRSSRSSSGGSRKVMNITTEQGDMMTIERADTEDEDDNNEDDNADNMDIKFENAEEWPSQPADQPEGDVADFAADQELPTDPTNISPHPHTPVPLVSAATTPAHSPLTTTAAPPSATDTSPTTAAPPSATDTSPTTAAPPSATDTSPTTAAPPSATDTSPTTAAPPSATDTSPTAAASPSATDTSPTAAASPSATDTSPTAAASPSATDTSPTTAAPPSAAATPPTTAVSPAADMLPTAATPPINATFSSVTIPSSAGLPVATSTPMLPGSRRSRKAARAAEETGVIDLTTEEDEEQCRLPADVTTSDAQDVKPNVEELNRQMQAEGGRSEGGSGENKEGEEKKGSGSSGLDSVDPGVTVKSEEDSKLGQVRHKYKLLEQRFRNLQHNVHKLLSFIVPDINLGSEEDIEHIVTEMIRVNCSQAKETTS